MFKGLVEWLRCCKTRHDKRKHEFGVLQATEIAKELFQIREHNGELWLTYNANLVCPMAMFQMPDVEAIITMRDLYVHNNCGTQESDNDIDHE